MKRITVALLALGTLQLSQAQTERDTIDVQVVDGKIAVSNEQYTRQAGQQTLWWRISTPGQQFADDGVSFSPAGSHRCQASDRNRLMRCDKTAEATAKRYSYVIRLVSTRSLQPSQPPQPDLWIQDE
ncbi:MAG: hypothetical protein Q8R98_05370 [Rubrivivax sp.]|nr:hypothetical protein [Rubrivivax sp.]MDP3226310.1 hypothetical protein [Rubrivivax sp.]MDP3611263.1 hypothetical protein [Rubrivivax sp.]